MMPVTQAPTFSVQSLTRALPHIPNPISTIIHELSTLLKSSPKAISITIDDQFARLPSEIQRITGYASAFIHVFLYIQDKLPSKTVITIDEELNEPLIQLVYNRKLSPEEEIQILNLVSKLLFKLADTEDDDRYLDIHVIIREEPR